MILEKINNVEDLRRLSIKNMNILVEELREYIIDVVSKNGGHLASSLGVVELTVALHYVYNTPYDRIIWDVGHQTYAHKILTGRRDGFKTLRKYQGMSGFPKICESEYDCYNTGHSSTSISLAVGEAVSSSIQNKNNKVVAVIGDGALTGGMAFEAINHAGHLKKDVTIILNDNCHSISENVGALSEYLTNIISTRSYNQLKKESYKILRKVPIFGNPLANFISKTEIGLKRLFVPGQFFEDLGIRYFGPIDGHDIKKLIKVMNKIKKLNGGPKVIHVLTKKGQGYEFSENDPTKFHGISPFNKEDGNVPKKQSLSFSKVFGSTLESLAEMDNSIVAITAAMTEGTGLKSFSEKFPERFFDVGIAEQHAVTFSAALANRGLKPFFAVYSTFLQRALDQLIHDVALMNLPVKFLIDRAGIVGEDGETHHGLFDISFLKSVPNLVILNPTNGSELRDMVKFASDYSNGPIVIRYPRGNVAEDEINYKTFENISLPLSTCKGDGEDLVIITYSDFSNIAYSVVDNLKKKNIKVKVLTLLSIIPYDLDSIIEIVGKCSKFVFLENAHIRGAISESIIAELPGNLREKYYKTFAFPNEVVCHGDYSSLLRHYNLSAEIISNEIEEFFNEKKI